MVQKIKRPAKDTEEAGIEPAIANYATYGFEDRGSHQTPSTSLRKSQLSDLNRVPARYEGAALPGELSWQNISERQI